MNDKILEGMIKTVLSDYKQRLLVNKIEVDFSLDFHDTDINPYQTAQKNGIDVSSVKDVGMVKVTYFRIVKLVKGDEPRVVFANYVSVDVNKKPAMRRERLLREAIKHFMLGGLEYAEALYHMHKSQQEATTDQPKMKVTKKKVAKKKQAAK